jgi:hypothetical protein
MKNRTTITAVLLLFCAAAASGAVQRTVATGQEIQNPQVAVAGTGDYMVVWSDLTRAQDSDVFARLFEASGKPKGGAFVVHESRAGEQINPRVAADERGHFVVVWQGGFYGDRAGTVAGGDGDGTGAFAQRFDRNGTRVGSPLRLSASAAGDQITPNVALGSDGSFVAVWQDCTGPQHRCSELRVGRFTAGGERKGEELKIPVLTATFYISGGAIANPTPDVAIEPGGFAIGWTEQEACYKFEYEKFPVIVHFTDAGRPVGQRFRLDDGLCEDATGWTLIALTTSRTGESAAFLQGKRNSFQLFAPGGDPAGARKVVGRRNPCSRVDGCEIILDAAMNSDGEFAVVWDQILNVRDPEPRSILSLQTQFFDPLGRPLGRRFEVMPTPTLPLPSAVVIAFTPDGSLLLVWGDSLAGNDASLRLFSRVIRPH